MSKVKETTSHFVTITISQDSLESSSKRQLLLILGKKTTVNVMATLNGSELKKVSHTKEGLFGLCAGIHSLITCSI